MLKMAFYTMIQLYTNCEMATNARELSGFASSPRDLRIMGDGPSDVYSEAKMSVTLNRLNSMAYIRLELIPPTNFF